MGLDITAYKVVAITTPHERSDDSCEEHVLTENPGSLSRQLAGLEPGRCYVPILDEDDAFSFHPGPYSVYNGWRETLAQAALGVTARDVWNKDQNWIGAPFESMIDFSDCEGIIGPYYCEVLARDFEKERRRVIENAMKISPEPEEFAQIYEIWAYAFQFAAGTGLVLFH